MSQGKTLRAYRGDRLVGVLDRVEGEPFYGFAYDESYLRSQHALPLSASLPLAAQRFSGTQALPFFEGLLPEGDARQVVARQFHVSPRDPAQLIRILGRDCAGDVTVVEADDAAQPPACGTYLRLPRGRVGGRLPGGRARLPRGMAPAARREEFGRERRGRRGSL